MKMASKPNPSETCDTLLNYLKKSNLNFHIEESPFAVTINIKKSLKRKKIATQGLLVFLESQILSK